MTKRSQLLAYIRGSTSRQGKSGLGIEAQRDNAMRKAQGRSWAALSSMKLARTLRVSSCSLSAAYAGWDKVETRKKVNLIRIDLTKGCVTICWFSSTNDFGEERPSGRDKRQQVTSRVPLWQPREVGKRERAIAPRPSR